MAKKEQEVTVIEEKKEVFGGLVIQDADDNMSSIRLGSGFGNEEVTLEDIVIPRLELCQEKSIAKNKMDAAFIPGLEVGDMYNSVTRENYGQEVAICPVNFKKRYLLWKDIKAGGGFKSGFDTLDQAQKALQLLGAEAKDVTIAETAIHSVLVVKSDGTREPLVVSMASSKLKASRDLNTYVAMRGGARFSNVFMLRSHYVPKGVESYWTFKVDLKTLGKSSPELLEEGKALYDLTRSGAAKMSEDYDSDQVIDVEKEEY